MSVKWVSAKNLKQGDKVLLSSGNYGIVEKAEVRELDEAETTYNFEVEGYHTYHVGEASVCVHNKKCGYIAQTVPDGYQPTFKNGLYQHNPKHGMVARGNVSAKISSQQYGQYALDNAISAGKGKALYAYNGKNLFQFMPHSPGVYHGFVTNFAGINSPQAASWLLHYFRL